MKAGEVVLRNSAGEELTPYYHGSLEFVSEHITLCTHNIHVFQITETFNVTTLSKIQRYMKTTFYRL
jgi:hypothetical protein